VVTLEWAWDMAAPAVVATATVVAALAQRLRRPLLPSPQLLSLPLLSTTDIPIADVN